ncbi:hypothetical protein JMJ55_04265 [Belnapia sp. T6]|uniref:Uncharacterized protein n=1 Tax=Belnapia mucosa TaxID=2804532 RepID=A0ABS1UYK4_9PROT|nr:hypothetical protein [Belnapia mucosa]MBL6454526.1 hypothetical protein [Belnapia mucosa]
MPNTTPPGAATRRLHHYTSYSRLGSIAARGLAFGEVSLTFQRVMQGVWLTDDTDPAGHGLIEAKREVRITVELDAADGSLHHWPDWGQRHLDSRLYQALDRTGSGKSARWWVYFGIIAPERVVGVVDLRRARRPIIVWRTTPADLLVERLVMMKQVVGALPGSIPILNVLAEGNVLARWLGPSEEFQLWTTRMSGGSPRCDRLSPRCPVRGQNWSCWTMATY